MNDNIVKQTCHNINCLQKLLTNTVHICTNKCVFVNPLVMNERKRDAENQGLTTQFHDLRTKM